MINHATFSPCKLYYIMKAFIGTPKWAATDINNGREIVMNKTLKRLTAVALSAVEAITVVSFGTVASAASTEINPNTIAVGENHSLVIKKDMSLWAAGDNSAGQLGVADVELSDGVKVMDNVVYVEANDDVSFAIDVNGTLYGWGDNSAGQISTTVNNYVITKPLKLMENVIAVSAGDTHTLAITADGTAYGWGSNEYGELGFEYNSKKNGVTEIKKDIVDVAAGDGFSLLVTADGALYACGNNSTGQLGYGNYRDQETPVMVLANGVADAEAGNEHALILKTDGTVWSTGLNDEGQLGNNNDRAATSSFVSTNLSNISYIFAGGNSSGAVNKSGSLYTWGYNADGQLQNGKTVSLFAPASVTTGVASAALGEHHSLVLKTNNRVSSVGGGAYGELFAESSASSVSKPTKVISDITCYSAGADHAAAIDEDGVLYTWGRNDCGQLGLGDTTSRKKPTKVAIKEKARRVWCGNKITFVQCETSVYVFGDNSQGLLGMSTRAANVVSPVVNANLYATNSLEIYTAADYCMALIDGSVFGWGRNTASRMLELPSKVSEPTVIDVPVSGITKLALGNSHVLALAGNEVYGWGSNNNCQLGTSGVYICDTPIQVVLRDSKDNVVAEKFTDIAACENYSFFVSDTGRAWGIGVNGSGQLGTDTYRVKTPYASTSSVAKIYAGSTASAALYDNGKLSMCGDNTNNALGNGSSKDISKFGTITGTSVEEASIGNGFGGYIDSKAVLYCWGDNTYGQVGNGSGGARVTPETVITDAMCAPVVKATAITLNKTTLDLSIKATEKLTVTVTPADAAGVNVTWSSSNPNVASVSADGTVTALSTGKATITAKTLSGLSAKCDVNVTTKVSSFSVTPSKSKTLSIGKSFTFKSKVYPSTADDKTLLFKSSNEDVAVVNASGKVTAIAAGKAVITITSKSNPAKTKEVIVKVRPGKAVVTSRKATSGGVILKWKDAEGADGYEVFRKVSGSSAKAKSVGDAGDSNAFVDDTAVKGKVYVYSVRAYVIIDGKKVYSSSYTQYKITAK